MKRIDEDMMVNAELFFAVIPHFPIGKLRKGDVTPSIKEMINVIAGGDTVSVTNFKGGKIGQQLYILGDDETTLIHGAHIKMKDAIDLLLEVDKVYLFKNFNGIWYEV